MEIRLNNIGIVSNSKITMDGLTVITGKNNSGKTTVGKTLYSILDAVCNIQQKAKNDRNSYIRKQLENVADTIDALRYLRLSRSDQEDALLADYPTIRTLFTKLYSREIMREEIEDFAHTLLEELKNFDSAVLENRREFSHYYKHATSKKDEESNFLDLFNEQRKTAITILEKLFIDIDKDIELIDYARESINQTLRVEFANQIQPVKFDVKESEIELLDGDSVFFRFKIVNDKIVDDGNPVYITSPYKKIYMIDNPFVLDNGPGMYRIHELNEIATDSILNPNRISNHNDKLRLTLKRSKKITVLEQTVLEHSLKAVKEKIDRIVPGTFEFSASGDYYIQSGTKLKFSNLATGSKMFSLIKMLLERGELDNTTMLILDEPEAHLHPEWQNAFAETIVLLVKELGTKILLTTHSPNFMLAIDAYMRKYNMAEQTNFYQTNFLEDGFVQYQCVNEDMGLIYQDFLQYLSEMKMLRNKYLHGDGE